MANLGCPEEMEAQLVDSSTQLGLATLPWSSITWSRARNQLSTATVVIAGASGGVECCGPIGTLFPWTTMIRIERNGSIVWDGPVTGWSTAEDGTVTVRASDRFILQKKRIIGAHEVFTASTPNNIIRTLLADAHLGNLAYDPYTFTVVSAGAEDEQLTREYKVESGQYIFDAISEVCDNSTTGYYCQVGSNLYVYEPTARFGCGVAGSGNEPKLGPTTTIGRPTVDVEGSDMATDVYELAAGQGAQGFPLIVINSQFAGVFIPIGRLYKSDVSTTTASSSDLSLMAGRLAVENACPAVTVERLRLAPTFGAPGMTPDLANLLPGQHCTIDYETECAFAVPVAQYFEAAGVGSYLTTASVKYARLDLLEFSVQRSQNSGIEETVMGSFRPVVPNYTP